MSRFVQKYPCRLGRPSWANFNRFSTASTPYFAVVHRMWLELPSCESRNSETKDLSRASFAESPHKPARLTWLVTSSTRAFAVSLFNCANLTLLNNCSRILQNHLAQSRQILPATESQSQNNNSIVLLHRSHKTQFRTTKKQNTNTRTTFAQW